MRLEKVLACVVLVGALGVSAHGNDQMLLGAIRGTVDVRLPLSRERVRPSVRELGSRDARGIPDRGQSIVYLETVPQRAFEGSTAGRAVLDQRQETFVPYALPVIVGTTVQFPNSDPIYHNVFSFSKPKRFDLGRYPQGRTKSVRFDRPGIVRVFCEIHSHMSAFILVFSHQFFASTDESGHYRIDAVPPGVYDVSVWTDGEVRVTASVTVKAGEATDLDFVVE
jgi:plastocyanin